ncbi:VOC family protein [Paraglaciecola sp. 25GB23A]|uniref:VOC family protein n=1 Tax=Paraglaciecola sp. 25GB23A TaxID=3156068 RepID=UPI0032AF0294
MMISNVSLLVSDYDRAIDFYVNKLGFILLCDVPVTAEQRWIRIAPKATVEGAVASGAVASASALVLTKATEQQKMFVGQQAGEGVFLFLQSDDFWQDYQRMKTLGVDFLEEPREEVYATVVIFRDCEGNKWDLLQPKSVA